MKFRTYTAAAMIAASSIVSSAHAQAIRDSFTYQGTLQDGGVPANGLYDITFLVYPQEVGGSVVFGGIQTVQNVEVVDGLFSAEVDFGVIGEIFDSNESRWLELRVSEAGQPGTTILAPRTKITPAALANYALRSGTSLQDAYNNAEARIDFDIAQGPLNLFGSASQQPVLNFYNSLGDIRASLGNEPSLDAGFLSLFGPTGKYSVRMERDVSDGGGGFVSISRADFTQEGIVLDGNVAGTFNPRIAIMGGERSIVFNTAVPSEQSVSLPTGSIHSVEMFNESGIAETQNGSSNIGLTDDLATVDTIESITVNAPTSGYVFVIATAETTFTLTNPFQLAANFGVSANPSSLPSNGDVELRLNGNLPSGAYDFPVTVQAIFSAGPGANTYYFVGDKNSVEGSVNVLDIQLSAIFVPTAYGNVTRESYADIPDQNLPIVAPSNDFLILKERNAAMQADIDRQQREIQEMKVMMDEMKRQFDNQNRD